MNNLISELNLLVFNISIGLQKQKFYGGKQTLNRQYWSRVISNNMQFGASQLNADFAVSFPTIFKYRNKIINNSSQTSNNKCGALK